MERFGFSVSLPNRPGYTYYFVAIHARLNCMIQKTKHPFWVIFALLTALSFSAAFLFMGAVSYYSAQPGVLATLCALAFMCMGFAIPSIFGIVFFIRHTHQVVIPRFRLNRGTNPCVSFWTGLNSSLGTVFVSGFWVGFTNIAGNYVASMSLAMDTQSAGPTLALMSLSAALVAVLARLLMHEKLRLLHWVGIALVTAGLVLMPLDNATLTSGVALLGVLAGICVGLSNYALKACRVGEREAMADESERRRKKVGGGRGEGGNRRARITPFSSRGACGCTTVERDGSSTGPRTHGRAHVHAHKAEGEVGIRKQALVPS